MENDGKRAMNINAEKTHYSLLVELRGDEGNSKWERERKGEEK